MATFGRYEILGKLGEGAMGVVYRARDTAIGRVVALKMLSAELGAEDELHARFRREAEAIGRLSHPNIATITRTGMILGTPDYMAAEQAMGKAVDRRSDVFSSGSVFYEFLTGEKPFKGKTLHAVLFQIIQEEPDPVLTLNPELPTRLAAAVHRMLVKDPDKRYQSMDEVGRDLQDMHVALRRSRS